MMLLFSQWYFEERDGGVAIHSRRFNKYLTVRGALQDSAQMIGEKADSPRIWIILPATDGSFQ